MRTEVMILVLLLIPGLGSAVRADDTPTPTPEPTCLGTPFAYHLPGGDMTCDRPDQRHPLWPLSPYQAVCISTSVSDNSFWRGELIHYRINDGPWQTHDMSYECYHMSLYFNIYSTGGDQGLYGTWHPGAGYGDRVDYYIELVDFTGYCSYYLHGEDDMERTPDEAEAQADPYHFTYPDGTPTPWPPITPTPSCDLDVTVEVLPEQPTLEVGETMLVEVNLIDHSQGCYYLGYDATLTQVGDDAPCFSPEQDVLGPPVNPGVVFEVTATTPGTVWFNAAVYGEVSHGGIFYWHSLGGQSVPVTVTSPESTPEPTTEPTQVPTGSPTFYDAAYELTLTSTELSAGEPLRLERHCWSTWPTAMMDEYILLEYQGQYWFHPSWGTAVEHSTWELEQHGVYDATILDLTWPDGAGRMEGLVFWGALLFEGSEDLFLIDRIDWGAV